MTYKEAAQSALDIQDACNLSGVVFSFARAILGGYSLLRLYS